MNIILKNALKQIIIISIFFITSTFTIFAAEVDARWFNPPKELLITFEQKLAIPRLNIFKAVTGMSEKDWSNKPDFDALPETTQLLMNKMQHKTYTVSELKSLIAKKPKPGNGTFTIVHADVLRDTTNENRERVDIGAVQAKNPGAVFQIASRAKALEGQQRTYCHPFDSGAHGLATTLGPSAVQGEEGQISCPLRAISQIYINKEKINLFGHLGIDIYAQDNSKQITPENLDKLAGLTESEITGQTNVLFYQNVAVFTGLSNVQYMQHDLKEKQAFNKYARPRNYDDANYLVTQPCFVDQVLVTAFEINPDKPLFKTLRQKDTNLPNKFARGLLRAAHMGTLYCAILAGKKDIFLTLVGCGAFQNDLTWTADILEDLMPVIKDYGLNVTLNALDSNGFLVDKNKEAWDRIKKLVMKNDQMNVTFDNTPTLERISTFLSTYKNKLLFGGLSILGLIFMTKYYFQSNASSK